MVDLSALWTVPGYKQSAIDIYDHYVRHYNMVERVWGTPLQFVEDLGRYGRINHRDVYYSLILALVMTVLRYVLTACIFLVSITFQVKKIMYCSVWVVKIRF